MTIETKIATYNTNVVSAKNADDYAVTALVPVEFYANHEIKLDTAKLDAQIAREQGNYSTTINGERVTFKNFSIVYIDAQSKLGYTFYRDYDGKKRFYDCTDRNKHRVISAKKIAANYVLKEQAVEQGKAFHAFFDNVNQTGNFFDVVSIVTYADGVDHQFSKSFDTLPQATDHVNQILANFPDINATIVIKSTVKSYGNYKTAIYRRDNDGSVTADIPDTKAFSHYSTTEIQSRLTDTLKAIRDNDDFMRTVPVDSMTNSIWSNLYDACNDLRLTYKILDFCLHDGTPRFEEFNNLDDIASLIPSVNAFDQPDDEDELIDTPDVATNAEIKLATDTTVEKKTTTEIIIVRPSLARMQDELKSAIAHLATFENSLNNLKENISELIDSGDYSNLEYLNKERDFYSAEIEKQMEYVDWVNKQIALIKTENAEPNVDDYAVSVEAQDTATDAEIENAKAEATKHDADDTGGETQAAVTHTEPNVDAHIANDLSDSLVRAMKIALEKSQEFCRAKDFQAVQNEMKLYTICAKALTEFMKGGDGGGDTADTGQTTTQPDAKTIWERVVATRKHGLNHVLTTSGRHMWFYHGELIDKITSKVLLRKYGFTIDEFLKAEKIADEYWERVERKRLIEIDRLRGY